MALKQPCVFFQAFKIYDVLLQLWVRYVHLAPAKADDLPVGGMFQQLVQALPAHQAGSAEE